MFFSTKGGGALRIQGPPLAPLNETLEDCM